MTVVRPTTAVRIRSFSPGLASRFSLVGVPIGVSTPERTRLNEAETVRSGLIRSFSRYPFWMDDARNCTPTYTGSELAAGTVMVDNATELVRVEPIWVEAEPLAFAVSVPDCAACAAGAAIKRLTIRVRAATTAATARVAPFPGRRCDRTTVVQGVFEDIGENPHQLLYMR